MNQLLIISTEFPPGPGGIGQHAYSLARFLSQSNKSVTVLTPGDYASAEEINKFDCKQTFAIIRYNRKRYFATYFDRIYKTLRAVLNSKPDYVILTGKFSLWQGLIIKLLFLRIRTIAILHGSEVNLSNFFLRKLTHISIATADILVPVSSFTKSLLPESIKIKHKNIQVIPNGIDEVWNIDEAKLNFPVLIGFPSLLTVGHVSPRKGQHRVIKALPFILQRYPQTHYHIVGRPINKDSLTILARELNVLDHITFHDRVVNHHDLCRFYRGCDIFMLLSENQQNGDVEGFGIVALEANLHRMPVVGAKYCGVEEAVSHTYSGFLVDGNNYDDIVEGIDYCLNNKDRLSIDTIKWAKRHKWQNIGKKYIELLR